MVLQFEKAAVSAMACPVSDHKSMELTQELRLGDGAPDIGRVLMAWAQPVLRGKEWQSDELSVSGGVRVTCLYAPEDGSEVRNLETWIPFLFRWDLESDTREGGMVVQPMVRSCECRCVSSRKVMIRCNLGCYMKAVSPMEAEIGMPESLPEDVQLLKRTYFLRIPTLAGETTFQLDEELPLSTSAPAPEKLLAVTFMPEIVESKVSGDKLVFKGKGNLRAVYRCGQGKVHSQTVSLPFSQFAELGRICDGQCFAQVIPAVTDLEGSLSDSGHIRLKAGLVAQYLMDRMQTLEVVEDAYSPFRRVEIQREELNLPVILEDRSHSINAATNLPGVDSEAIDLQVFPDFPGQRRLSDKIEIVSPGVFQTLYETEDGILQTANGRWEHSMEIPAGPGVTMEMMPPRISDSSARSLGEGMELNAQLELETLARTETHIPMVMGMELAEELTQDPERPSVILTRAGEDDLWQLAKSCGSTVAAIRSCNGLTGDAEPDRMLLVPVL